MKKSIVKKASVKKEVIKEVAIKKEQLSQVSSTYREMYEEQYKKSN